MDIVTEASMVSEGAEETTGEGERERLTLQFLDSMDAYLTLYESLSSSLRQGWFDLASARHSMGTARLSSVLFDLKEHQAATLVQVDKNTGGDEDLDLQKNFTLVKSGSCEISSDAVEGEKPKKHDNSNLRFRGQSGAQEPSPDVDVSPAFGGQVQKDRSKQLSVFGTLVSPKLRSAQVSFETALDILIEVANARSSMLSAFSRLQE